MRSELIRGAIGVLDSDLAFRATAQVWRERLTHRAYTRLSTVCAPPPLGSSRIEHLFSSEQRKCAFVVRAPDQTAIQLQTSVACTHSPIFMAHAHGGPAPPLAWESQRHEDTSSFEGRANL